MDKPEFDELVAQFKSVEKKLSLCIKSLQECRNAISGGQQYSDFRGLIYQQEFGEAFVRYLNETLEKVSNGQDQN